MSSHDVVLCRSFGNEPLVRIVWSVKKEGILICGQEGLNIGEKTHADIVPVLAPFDAIYEYDEDLYNQLDRVFRDPKHHSDELDRLWRQAKLYKIHKNIRLSKKKGGGDFVGCRSRVSETDDRDRLY